MRVSGFTITKNARKFGYPVDAAIRSILPICDEFIVNVGKSEDDTLDLIKNLNEPKIKIIETDWGNCQTNDILSFQTNAALEECRGDWAFYVQADELIHEADLPRLESLLQKYLHDDSVDVFRFQWLHFFGSYYRYRIDRGWFQKQDRIVRNNGQIESCTDAWKFQRKDGKPLKVKKTGCLLYHYGWVQPAEVMTKRRVNAMQIYEAPVVSEEEKTKPYDYGDLNRFPAYFGSHPKVMEERIRAHHLSQQDKRDISKRYWWHPAKILRLRYKTFNRVKERIV